jgi:hypothetical protein
MMYLQLDGCTVAGARVATGDTEDEGRGVVLQITSDRSPSYIDLHLEIESEGRLRSILYDKRDDFNFPIVNFPFIYSKPPLTFNFEV